MYSYDYTAIDIYVHIYMYIHVGMYMYVQIGIYMYIYIHIHIHIHMCLRVFHGMYVVWAWLGRRLDDGHRRCEPGSPLLRGFAGRCPVSYNKSPVEGLYGNQTCICIYVYAHI